VSAAYSGVAHLAGPDITVDGRWLRQRCVWCGAILVDYDMARIAVQVEPGEEPSPPATWEAGKFVEVDPPMSSVLDWEGDQLPPHSCMRIPPEETR
jgi:hypothetical protein